MLSWFGSTSSSNCCFLTFMQISQEAGQVVWYSHLFKNFPQFVVIHPGQGFGVVSKAEVDVFLELSCFFNDPTDVGNLSLVPLPFLNPAWTSISSCTLEGWLGEFWALICYHVRWEQLCCSLSVLWHCQRTEYNTIVLEYNSIVLYYCTIVLY